MKRIIILAVLLLVSFSATAECYSEGIRKGDIQKFSMKGIVTKSWEGEMVQEGIRTKSKDGVAGITNIWKFSVTDPAVAKKIEDAMFAGGNISVKYCQSALHNTFVSDTSYIVIDARAAPK